MTRTKEEEIEILANMRTGEKVRLTSEKGFRLLGYLLVLLMKEVFYFYLYL